MNTKIIKIAICAIFCSLHPTLQLIADDSTAAAGIELSTVKTISGKLYKDVELITADKSGLLFRHSKGTAKVDFTDLNTNLRDMFEPEPVVETDNNNPADDVAIETKTADTPINIEIVTHTRVLIPLLQNYNYSHCQTGCNPFNPATVNWRPHWGRYHYGLSYANFHCRQAAERDLLRVSGFLR